MLPHETKDALLSNVPDLPPLAAGILCHGTDLADRLPALAALAERDTRTSVGIMVEAARLFPRQPPKSFESAATCLGARGLKRAVLKSCFPGMFDDKEPEGGIDQEMIWWQANVRAACAEHLAEEAGASCLSDTYSAAFLADIGRLGLEACGAPGADDGLYLHRATGLRALENEQRLYGADHAIAGKWMLEHWGLPVSIAEAVWLQYHPAGSLDNTSYPVALIDLIAAARKLTAAQMTGRIDEFIEETVELRERLGIREDVWRRCAHTDYDQRTPSLEPLEAPLEILPSGHLDPEELRREAALYKAIAELYADCFGEQSERSVLAHIETHLREFFPAPAGLCFLSDSHGALRAGRIWRGMHEPGQTLEIARERSERDPAQAVQRLLGGIGPAALEGAEVRNLHGLLAAPIAAGGAVYGQIIADTGEHAATPEQMTTLAQFARACAVVVGEVRRRESAALRQEELATALWKQESQHRASMRKLRLESIGRMAAGAAHEINNPLAIISGRAQMLLGRASDGDQGASLETIVQQSRRASKIITDLMQFARPEDPKLRPLALSQVVHQTCAMLADRLREYGVRVVEDYASDAPLIDGDRHQLEQVFTHLISNAAHAMKGMGGMLNLRVKMGSDGRSVVAQVSDSGPGIAPEHLEHVFEPFFTTKRQDEPGTGLGLSVSHSIVERHLGSLTLHSALGEGCTCTLRFPASARQEAPAPEPSIALGAEAPERPMPETILAKQARAAAVRVLVCESGDDAREVLVQTLTSRGYEVAAFGDGIEALAEALTREPDAVICDLQELVLDDVPLVRQLRQRFTRLPILAFSNRTPAELKDEPLRSLVTAVVQKPFHLDTLFGELSRALGEESRLAL
ncbi:MAG: HDOD domain-containing protein [Candidatus Hydrogenedens sp.]|nr:HDOD domain-containing protein [Candidatus Hydrogenedens sp.]